MPEKKQISKLDWYCPLYADPKLAGKKKRLVRKLNHNAVRPDLYLITFAANGQDLFDILSSAYLKQPALRRNLPEIVGIAQGREEAVALVQQILEETLQETGAADVKAYLQQHRQNKE